MKSGDIADEYVNLRFTVSHEYLAEDADVDAIVSLGSRGMQWSVDHEWSIEESNSLHDSLCLFC